MVKRDRINQKTGVDLSELILFRRLNLPVMIKRQFAEELARKTEVWIAEMPEHMIHLNAIDLWNQDKE